MKAPKSRGASNARRAVVVIGGASAGDLADSALASLRAQRREPSDHPASGGYGTVLERLGLTVPELREVTRRTAREAKSMTARQVLDLVRRLVGSGTFEGRQVAYEILGRRRDARAELDARSLERLARGMDNWVTVDTFAAEVVGRAWAEGRIDDPVVERWTRSKDRWWRRLALASTVALNTPARGGHGDPDRTLAGVTGEGAWEPWILYMLSAVEETALWTLAKIEAVRELAANTTAHIRAQLPKVYSRELVDVIFSQPYCRIANLVEAGVVGRQTAARYLNELQRIGVLEKVAAGRERPFVHSRLLRLLTTEENVAQPFA